MSDPVRFLTSLSQALSAMVLYPAGHPARERVADAAYADLGGLMTGRELPSFTFLDGDVIAGRERLRALRGWEWSARLEQAGVGRIEFERVLTRDEFEGLLEELHVRLTPGAPDTAGRRQMRDLGVRLGAVGLDLPGLAAPLVAAAGFSLAEEAEAIAWVHAEVAQGRRMPMLEAEAVVRSLAIAMHGEAGVLLPLLQLKEFDQYTTTHALNVAVLSMGLAESIGLGAREVRAIGVSGLLHDIGKTLIPIDVLTKPGRLSEEERRIMNRHPSDGARLILRGDAGLELAAVVAYEHHIMLDGGGYPQVHYPRGCAYGSRLVHVCDVFDALSTRRPYRDAWPQEQTLAYLEAQGGVELDPALVAAFCAMMRRGDARVRTLGPDGQPLSAPDQPGGHPGH